MKHKEYTRKKKVLIGAGAIAGACLLFFLCLLLVLTVTEYRPEAEETLAVNGDSSREIRVGESISVMSWNIGYGALGDNADFFMDG